MNRISLSPSRLRGVASRLLPRPEWRPFWVAGLAYLPMLALHARELWRNPHYQFFPTVLLGAGALAVPACRRLGPLELGDRRWSALLLGLALGLLGLACAVFSPWLGAVAGLAMLLALAYELGGRRLLGAVLPAWFFLWLAIPPPFQLDLDLIDGLQVLMADGGDRLLDLLGVFHVMEGNVVAVPGRQLMVEQACSGIHSLYAVLTCALFFVIRTRRPPARSALLLLAAVGWVLAGNVVRVTTVAGLFTTWGIDWSTGWRHESLGLLVFALVIGLTYSTDQALILASRLGRLGRYRRSRRGREAARTVAPVEAPIHFPGDPLPPKGLRLRLTEGWAVVRRVLFAWPVRQWKRWVSAPLSRRFRTRKRSPVRRDLGPTRLPALERTRFASRTLTRSFAGLLVLQVGLLGLGLFSFLDTRVGTALSRRFAALDADFLAARVGPFERQSFETEFRDEGNTEGAASRFWRYRFDGRAVVVSIDYPMKGWHELTECYKKKGWALVDRAAFPGPFRARAARGTIVEARFAHSPGRYGFLDFCLFDRGGQPLDTGQIVGYLRRCFAFWRQPWVGEGAIWREALLESYQVQVFVESESPLTAAEQAEARAFFEQVRAKIRTFNGRGPGVSS